MSSIASIGAVAGGLGLVLLGLRLWTDGLRVVGGPLLAERLARGLRDRRWAFVTGLVIGLCVPGSHLSVAAVLGLPAAGAARGWVLAGLSVGGALLTPMLASAGLAPDLYSLALAIIAFGVLLAGTGLVTERFAFTGRAVIGCGVLLLGAQLCGVGWAGLPALHLDALDVPFSVLALVCVVAGALVSAALRSTCAAGVLVVLAADAGALAPASGAAALVGVGLGSIVAALPSLRTPSRAREGAVAHTLQQAWIAAVGLVLLGCSLPMFMDPPVGLAQPAAMLTVFLGAYHTIGILAWHVVGPALVSAIEHRLPSLHAEEPRGIDPRALVLPDVGFGAVQAAIEEQCDLALRTARRVLLGEKLSTFRIDKRLAEIAVRASAVDDAAQRLVRGPVTSDLAAALVEAPCWSLAVSELFQRALEHTPFRTAEDELYGTELGSRLRHVQLVLLHQLEGCIAFRSRSSPEDHRGEMKVLEGHLADVEERVLRLCASGRLGPIEGARTVRRVGYLRELGRKSIEVADRRMAARANIAPRTVPALASLFEGAQRRLAPATTA